MVLEQTNVSSENVQFGTLFYLLNRLTTDYRNIFWRVIPSTLDAPCKKEIQDHRRMQRMSFEEQIRLYMLVGDTPSTLGASVFARVKKLTKSVEEGMTGDSISGLWWKSCIAASQFWTHSL